MSDNYSSAITEFLDERQTSIRAQVAGNIDTDPEQAARAMKLEQLTAVPAPVILGDFDTFEKNTKAQLASSILENNESLRNYIAADKMAALVSNDDYAQLDTVSEKMNNLYPKGLGFIGAPAAVGHSALFAAIRGFKEGIGEGGVGAYIVNDPNRAKTGLGPLEEATLSVLTSPVEIALRSLSGLIHGTIKGAAAGAESLASQLGASEMTAQRIGRDAGGLLEMLTNQPLQFVHPVHPKVIEAARQASETLRRSQPWIDAGLEPPQGLDPILDEVKIKQSELDLTNLDEIIKEAQSSATKERSPELFATFLRQHTEAKIGVSAEGIQKLYGEKMPTPEDGLLGWVPGIAEQYSIAVATGGDVMIPLADWAAKVDPSVNKELSDFIRVRPGGVTKAEAEGVRKYWAQKAAEPPVEGPIESLREAAALKPLFQLDRERKLTLQRLDQGEGRTADFAEGDKSHGFAIVDEKGKQLADLYIAEEKGGKVLYVDDIRGADPNSIGPRAMRSVLQQLKAEFPNAEFLEGFRVSGARDKAGSWKTQGKVRIRLDKADEDLSALEQELADWGTWETFSEGVEAHVRPTELYTAQEQAIVKAVDDEVRKLLPKGGVDVQETTGIEITDARVKQSYAAQGVYITEENAKPLILWAFSAENPIQTMRHEIVHHLRQMGYLTAKEWSTLAFTAVDQGWMEKYDVARRYSEENLRAQIEEAVVDAFAEYRQGKRGGKVGEALEKLIGDKAVQAIFEKLDAIVDAIRAAVTKITGREPTWQELFAKIESGEVGSRSPSAPASTGYKRASKGPAQPDLPGILRMEDRELFDKAAAIGMTVDQYKRYMKRIQERQAEDLKAIADKAIAEERKTQTKEWKEARDALRPQVEQELAQRPDFVTDAFFRTGELYGEKLDTRPKINSDYLTPEQKTALPENYVSDRGMHPDDVAGLFGYPSGALLVDKLIELNKAREVTGMAPKAFFNRMVDLETDRQMKNRYGDLEQNILDEAKDHILSETQVDLLAEETLLLAEQAGQQLSINKEALRAQIQERFEGLNLRDVSTDRSLAAAGKAGKAAEMALLKGDPAEAFKFKQQQFYAFIEAQEAKKLEKLIDRFDKQMKRFSEPQVKSIDQEYMNFIHRLMQQAEIPVKRSWDNINEAMALDGHPPQLATFVAGKNADGYELNIADNVLDGNFKPYEAMTVREFREFRDAVTNLAHTGRMVRSIEIAGKRFELEQVIDEVVANVQTLPLRAKRKHWNLFYGLDASITRLEEIVKDLDLRRDLGPLYNALIRPMISAKHKEYQLQEALSKKLHEIYIGGGKWRKTLTDTIPQDFFIDPTLGVPFELTRENMINIMLNFGNRSNIEKFTRGWVGKDQAAQFEGRLWNLFERYANKEDWDFVQQIWDIFDGWKDEISVLYHNLSGLTPEMIKPEAFQNRHGAYAGGYFPIIFDRYYSGTDVGKNPGGKVMNNNYYKATTANHHTITRTKYFAPIEFMNTIETVASRMQQVMHDISYRAAVLDAQKIIYNKKFRNAMRQHYGPEYEAQLEPWLSDVANHYNQNEKGNATVNAILRRFRFNTVVNSLGINLRVLLSPDIGALNPKYLGLALSEPQATTKLAWEHSQEIPHTFRNMDRDFREKLERAIVRNKWDEFQADAARWGFVPLMKVSQGFRVATFLEHYKKGLARGLSEADAAEIADSKVRERHGSGGVPDLPAIMRGSESMKLLTLFYGYFNTMQNWARQMPGQFRRGEWENAMVTFYGSIAVGAAFGALLFNDRTEKDSWFKIMGKAMLLQPLGGIPFLREAGNMFIEGHQPRTPWESIMQAMKSLSSDAIRIYAKQRPKNPIKNTANVIGFTFGLPMGQIGRTAEFLHDVKTGEQRPRNFQEWVRGLIHGEARLKPGK